MISNLISKLGDRQYRSAYVVSQIAIGIPFQVRALRQQHQWSQTQLAEKTGMKQSRISAIEQPGRGTLNIETLERIAAAFDVALEVRFAPFSELIERSESFDPDTFRIASFEDEFGDSTERSVVQDDNQLVDTIARSGQYQGHFRYATDGRHISSQSGLTRQIPAGSEIPQHTAEARLYGT